MTALIGIVWFGIGVVQFVATLTGAHEWLGLPWLVAAFGAMFVAWIPLVGSWGWSWLAAGALFFGVPLGMLLLVGSAGLVEAVTSRR